MVQDKKLQDAFIQADILIDKIKKKLDTYEMGGGSAYLRDIRQDIRRLQEVQGDAYHRVEAVEKVIWQGTKLTSQPRERIQALP